MKLKGDKMLKQNDLIGSWELEAFQIESTTKKISSWGRNSHGLLIYTDSGHMSVSINRDIEGDPEDPANIFKSILFYSGTYQLKDQTIYHQVTNASNPARIGKEMIRYARLEKDRMTLTTPEESFGKAILIWKRVSK